MCIVSRIFNWEFKYETWAIEMTQYVLPRLVFLIYVKTLSSVANFKYILAKQQE